MEGTRFIETKLERLQGQINQIDSELSTSPQGLRRVSLGIRKADLIRKMTKILDAYPTAETTEMKED